jgi:deoxyinosine 3'endonuclease (endonuclease V)
MVSFGWQIWSGLWCGMYVIVCEFAEIYLLITLGQALRSLDSTRNPIFVSVGHRMTLSAAIQVTLHCCKYRVPEPVRQADQLSRAYIRQNRVTNK